MQTIFMQTAEEDAKAEKAEIKSALEKIVLDLEINKENKPDKSKKIEIKKESERLKEMENELLIEPLIIGSYSQKEYWQENRTTENSEKKEVDYSGKDKKYERKKPKEEKEYKLRKETEEEIKKKKFAHTFNLSVIEKGDKSLAEKTAKELHRMVNFTLNVILYDLAQA